jgi:hypothetical protein
MKIKFWNKIAESRIAFIAFLLLLYICVDVIIFMLYILFLDNEPIKIMWE